MNALSTPGGRYVPESITLEVLQDLVRRHRKIRDAAQEIGLPEPRFFEYWKLLSDQAGIHLTPRQWIAMEDLGFNKPGSTSARQEASGSAGAALGETISATAEAFDQGARASLLALLHALGTNVADETVPLVELARAAAQARGDARPTASFATELVELDATRSRMRARVEEDIAAAARRRDEAIHSLQQECDAELARLREGHERRLAEHKRKSEADARAAAERAQTTHAAEASILADLSGAAERLHAKWRTESEHLRVQHANEVQDARSRHAAQLAKLAKEQEADLKARRTQHDADVAKLQGDFKRELGALSAANQENVARAREVREATAKCDVEILRLGRELADATERHRERLGVLRDSDPEGFVIAGERERIRSEVNQAQDELLALTARRSQLDSDVKQLDAARERQTAVLAGLQTEITTATTRRDDVLNDLALLETEIKRQIAEGKSAPKAEEAGDKGGKPPEPSNADTIDLSGVVGFQTKTRWVLRQIAGGMPITGGALQGTAWPKDKRYMIVPVGPTKAAFVVLLRDNDDPKNERKMVAIGAYTREALEKLDPATLRSKP